MQLPVTVQEKRVIYCDLVACNHYFRLTDTQTSAWVYLITRYTKALSLTQRPIPDCLLPVDTRRLVQEELKKLAYNHEQSNDSVPLDDLKPSVGAHQY